ncbi:uncharacterized protein [Cicer arietinum]|uniref:CCR4-NOT transcription complex subunit 9-like isoform X2 n=1 Tax=Cicer arietinum TaxID=3827 RepID=A0A1S3DYZ7_CICAR|nr:CCR4-NOT transcription complex subunit 9-like isoform X2 [Cicer arietinum]
MTDLFHDLAPLLWNAFGIAAVFLQEIISTYPALSPPTLTPAHSIRVCNALALLQCVACHPDTRMLLIKAYIPLYLYPILRTTNMSAPYEFLRLASLGVIGALVKANTKEVFTFLLSSEIIPLCLLNMEIGRETTKTIATFIVEKIMSDEVGLDYVCATAERYFAVGRVLDIVLESLEKQPSPRLLKIIIPCYARLSSNPRAGLALTSNLPDNFGDVTFIDGLREDPTTWNWVKQLLDNARANQARSVIGRGGGGGIDDNVAPSSE